MVCWCFSFFVCDLLLDTSFQFSSNLEEPADIFESPSAQPQRQSASARDLPDLPVTCDLAESEAQDVEEFLQKNEINSGVVPLMRKYVFSLSKQFHRNW